MWTALSCAALLLQPAPAEPPPAPPPAPPTGPNVVLLMADDLGWGDVGWNAPGAVARTPHLDALAARSLVFDRFYAQSPVCSPTRASVLTGRHPFRVGIRNANDGHLPADERTLAELLRDAGYRTGHFGKWHLGTLTRDRLDSNRGGRPRGEAHFAPPQQRGFDVCFSTEAKVPTFDPMLRPAPGVARSAGRWAHRSLGWLPLREGEPAAAYGTHYWDERGDAATEGLRGDDSALIVDRALAFIADAVEAERPFLAVVWFHAPHLPVVAAERDRAAYPDRSPYEASYHGCITAMDRAIGRLVDALQRLGVADDTLVAFTSDNGPEGDDAAPGRAGPFRGRKRSLYEGGVRVPSLLCWPARWPDARRLRRLAACTTDYLPTIAAAAGVAPPPDLDGVDLLPLLEGDAPRPGPMGFVAPGKAAWHDGDDKLVGSRERGGAWRWELYDLAADPGETEDLAAARPDRLAALRAALLAWSEPMRPR